MSADKPKISTRIIGAAGEHYVVSQILRRGNLAALAPDGAPNSDIIVTDIDSNNLCSIQVKTRNDFSKGIAWRMNIKHENIESENLFYCFVALGKTDADPIITYIIPSKVVAKVVRESHKYWLKKVKRDGKARKDTPIRLLSRDYSKTFDGTEHEGKYDSGWMDKYCEKWDLIIK